MIDELGRGGMGVVYRVEQVDLQRLCALKVLYKDDAGLMLREGRVQARLAHPNVVRVLNVVDVYGSTGLVLEYVEGASLSRRLLFGPLELEEVDRLARGLLDGIAAAHQLGVLHRDLKPENILLSSTDQGAIPKVADFGLARLHDGDRRTAVGAIKGTLGYMAPEQMRDTSSVGAAADVWALGVVLYEMLYGRRPFVGRSVEALLAETANGPPALAGREAPERMTRAIRAALQAAPWDRPDAVGLRDLWCGSTLVDRSAATWGSDSVAVPPAASTRTANTFEGSAELPVQADRFVGRHRDQERLREALGTATLVTLHGPGGMGKTRLANHLIQETTGLPPVLWCDLTETRSALEVAVTVVEAFGVALEPGDPIGQVHRLLTLRGPLLVVLDNFEQVAEHAPATVGRWLGTGSRFLVTSRVVLGIRGEVVVPAEPLSTSDGVELFTIRAKERSPDVDLPRHEVEALVTLLEGIPLALEVAAARMRIFSVQELVERGESDAGVFHDRRRPDRHATVDGVLQWSWGLLTEPEQSALCQLSVFRGGFDLRAAEAVLEVDQDPLEVVETLLDHALVYRKDGRFGMYMPIRSFAALRLQDRVGTQRRHIRWFARYGKGGDDYTVRPRWTAELRRERANLIAACRNSRREEPELVVATLSAVGHALIGDGSISVLCAVCEEAVAKLEGCSELYLAQWRWGIALRYADRAQAARVQLERALGGARAAGDDAVLGDIEGTLAASLSMLGDTEAASRSLRSSIEHHRRRGAHPRLVRDLVVLGNQLVSVGRCAEAETALLEATALGAEGGSYQPVALGSLGVYYHALGLLEQAETAFDAALALAWDPRMRSRYLLIAARGRVLRARGRLAEAAAACELALQHFEAVGQVYMESVERLNLATFDLEDGHYIKAAAQVGLARTLMERVGSKRGQGACDAVMGSVLAALGRDEEAVERFAVGERLLRETAYRAELADLLLRRAIALGTPADRVEGEALTQALGVLPASALGRLLQRARNQLGQADPE